jgi:uncharacterized protein YbcI
MAHTDVEIPPPPSLPGDVLEKVSRAMVRLHKEQFGRGPTRSRSHFAGQDVLVCVLEDTMTPAERRLAELGEHERLRDTRLFLQHASEDDVRAAVEAIIGRRVRAVTSSFDTKQDVVFAVFMFEPSA